MHLNLSFFFLNKNFPYYETKAIREHLLAKPLWRGKEESSYYNKIGAMRSETVSPWATKFVSLLTQLNEQETMIKLNSLRKGLYVTFYIQHPLKIMLKPQTKSNGSQTKVKLEHLEETLIIAFTSM